ncbi:hypothetical protein BDA96_02G291400 [Sorghum bicolor]|uniref:Uncharacterized protein n=2 Tax=Sorghum bicolor TaxID=4558 RepID=A0A921UWV3_SORBI|nr:hypothetical protein BDA96_02G291400 [Sorghum bicolor]KXG36075.1 hypothetical protein SORBI_3002G277000 [Sorghum bicolor]
MPYAMYGRWISRIHPVKRLWSWENRCSGVGRAGASVVAAQRSGTAAEDVRGAPAIRSGLGAASEALFR